MADLHTGGSMDIKLLLEKRKAEKVQELKVRKELEKRQYTSVDIATDTDPSTSATTVPPAWEFLATEKDIVSKTTVDSKIISTNAASIISLQKPIAFNCQPRSFSSTNQNVLNKELETSQSLNILRSIESDKRRFFQPLADAITSSSAEKLGTILLRLCVAYPDARAVVESLLTDTAAEQIIDNQPLLFYKSSNNHGGGQVAQDLPPITKSTEETLLLPVKKSNQRLEEEPRQPLSTAKSARKNPQVSQKSISTKPRPPVPKKEPQTLRKLIGKNTLQTPDKSNSTKTPIASEKRKREEHSDISIVSQSQMKSNPYYVIPKRSKIEVSSSDRKEAAAPPKLSSRPPSTPENSQLKAFDPLQHLFDSDDSGGESSSGKCICAVTDCRKSFINKSSLTRHIKTVHKSEGEPFGCPICPKQFSRQDYVYRHLENTHTSKDMTCIPCGFKFRDIDSLSAHMRTEHGVRKPKST